MSWFILSCALIMNCTMDCSIHCTGAKKDWHPYYINTIEMRSLWMEIKYIKSATRLLDRDWVNKGGLDLFKEVLWVSVDQLASKLQPVKVGALKKILPLSRPRAARTRLGLRGRIFSNYQLWQLITLQPVDLQRPTVPLWKDLNLLNKQKFQLRGLAGFLIQVMLHQSDLIYIGLML